MAGAAHAGDGRHRQDLQEHRRLPRARHRASCRPTSTRAATTSRSAEGDIRFGLGAVKGVGAKAIETILAARTTAVHLLRRLLPARARAGHQQAGGREPDQVRRVRLARHLAAGVAGGRRRRDALGRARRARGELESAEPLRGRNRGGRGDVGAPGDPGRHGVVREGAATCGEGTIGFFITGHPLDKFQRDLGRLANALDGDCWPHAPTRSG